jgi:hypothetical protein
MSRSPRLGAVIPLLRPALLVMCALLGLGAGASGAGPVPAQATASHRPSRHLAPIPLKLDPPALPPAVLAGQPLSLQLRPSYDGEFPLTFALDSGPVGMTIDPASGVLTWTPPDSAEGSEATIAASASDGQWTARTSFTLEVAKTTPIASSLVGGTLTVTAPGSLHGLGLTFPDGTTPPAAQIVLATVQGISLPALPEGVRRVSDLFTSSPVSAPPDTRMKVSLPVSLVPSGSAPQDLCLFAWGGDDGSGSGWIPVCADLDVLPDRTTTIGLTSLGGLGFIGVLPPLPATPGVRSMDLSPGTCEAGTLMDGFTDERRWRCCIAADPAAYVVVGFEGYPLWLRGVEDWHQRAEVVASSAAIVLQALRIFDFSWTPRGLWIADSTASLGELALPLSFRDDDSPRVVTDARPGQDSNSLDAAQCEIANALFRAAAGHVRRVGLDTLALPRAGGEKTAWVVSGLARWFEDMAYPSTNSYRWDFPWTGGFPAILRPGLAAAPLWQEGGPDAWRKEPVLRSLFWKLVSSTFTFDPKDVLVADLASDPTGLAALQQALVTAPEHPFDTLFPGESGFDFARVLVRYSILTEGANDVWAIDANAPTVNFEAPLVLLTPAESGQGMPAPSSASLNLALPPAAVVAFEVAPVGTLQPGEIARLTFTPGGTTIGAWIADTPVTAATQGTSLVARGQPLTYSYGTSKSVPAQFVAIVNPSLTDTAQVEVRAALDRPVTASDSLGFAFDDPFMNCTHWLGHLDVMVSAPGAEGMVVAINQEEFAGQPSDELTVEVSANQAVARDYGITGTYTVRPASVPPTSDHCAAGGGSYYVFTYSVPQGPGGQPMQMYAGGTWYPSMGAFTLAEHYYNHHDSMTIYWHVTRRKFDPHDTLVETKELGEFSYGNVSLNLYIATP